MECKECTNKAMGDYRYCTCPPTAESIEMDRQRIEWARMDQAAAIAHQEAHNPEWGPRKSMPSDRSAHPCRNDYIWLSLRGE